MFNVVEQALVKPVRSRSAPTVSVAEMCSLVQTNPVADKIVRSVLSNTGFIVLIVEAI